MKSSASSAFLALAAYAVGIVAAALVRHLPARGWAAIILLLPPVFAFTQIDPRDVLHPSNFPFFILFMFSSPAAVAYAFRARKRAPDRGPARAAFVGALILGSFSLYTLAGVIYGLIF
jgi:uncharacterized membrane protein